MYFPAVHKQRAWSLMPVTLLYVGNVAFALMSLQNLNIPMYNTLKRMTPVIVLVTKVVPFSLTSQYMASTPNVKICVNAGALQSGCLDLSQLSEEILSPQQRLLLSYVSVQISVIHSVGGTRADAGSACSRQCRPSRLPLR